MEGTADDYFDPDAIAAIDAWADFRHGHLQSGCAMDEQTVAFDVCKRHLNTLHALVEREMMEEAKHATQNPQPAQMPQVEAPVPVRRKR